jgi:hypothetical protein
LLVIVVVKINYSRNTSEACLVGYLDESFSAILQSYLLLFGTLANFLLMAVVFLDIPGKRLYS